MRNQVIGLISGLALVFSAATASAINVDVNIAGVFTDSSFATLAGDYVGDASGDEATVTLQAGQGILLTIDIANPNGDLVTDIFTTLIHTGTQLAFLGGAADPEILAGGPVFMPTSLGRVANPAIKLNSPNPDGGAGDVWVQSTAFASTGTTGTGPNIAAVQLFYVVTGAAGSDEIVFELTQTDGDPAPVGGLVGSGAIINVVPEPGTALLMGLGLFGLASAGRRQA
jgi:hypothetical protein